MNANNDQKTSERNNHSFHKHMADAMQQHLFHMTQSERESLYPRPVVFLTHVTMGFIYLSMVAAILGLIYGLVVSIACGKVLFIILTPILCGFVAAVLTLFAGAIVAFVLFWIIIGYYVVRRKIKNYRCKHCPWYGNGSPAMFTRAENFLATMTIVFIWITALMEIPGFIWGFHVSASSGNVFIIVLTSAMCGFVTAVLTMHVAALLIFMTFGIIVGYDLLLIKIRQKLCKNCRYNYANND